MPIDIVATEAVIARESRRLVDNLEHPPTPELLQALQSLFAVHQGGAFDGILQPTIRVQNDHQLIIRGLLSWSGLVELFGAELTLAEGRDALLDYVLNFGRGDAPDRKISTEQRAQILPELRKAGEWSWAQTFRKR